jgi:D-2-hydroxyacid dehydrogenase (NADP+)
MIRMASKVLTRDPDAFVDRLAQSFAGIEFFGTTQPTEALKLCADCDVLMTRNDDRFRSLIAAMPRLRWIQALATGTDLIEACPDIRPGVTITAARGFHGPQMSELAFLFMLALSRNFPSILESQKERRWQRSPQKLLLDKTVVVLGVGRVAEELAKRCKVFGMRVIGVSAGRSSAPSFDAIHPRDRLADVVAEADFVIVIVPASNETRHLVDAAVLNAMKPSAALINLARGEIVDDAALIEALAAGRIARAGLDVFQTEPLPPDHPLWRLENVIITSHIGGMSDIYADQVMPLVIENLGTYLAGTPSRMRYIVRT